MTRNDDDGGFIWLRPEPSRRKPRYSRDRIARTALHLADRHGFEAVTMKGIATELGASTMSLYYYVRTKADIVALMHDAILEDVLVPAAELPDGWRDGTATISRRTRTVLLDHPWALASLRDAQFGPNAIRHYEQSLAALHGSSLDPAQKAEFTAIVDAYVHGSAAQAVEVLERTRAAAHDPTMVRQALAFGEHQLRSGNFPELAQLAATRSSGAEPDGPGKQLDQLFEVGLGALLDGLARQYAIATSGTP
jgi:AcrR family transcriptional regulator